MVRQTKIITPVLKYWGLEDHPFADFILKGEMLNLFINREWDLRRLHNSLNNRLSGVFGSQGVGKSSFLQQFAKTMNSEKIPVAYVKMSGTTEKSLYRQILAVILKARIDFLLVW